MAIEQYHYDSMVEAIREAEIGIADGGLPIGAVLTRDNEIIARDDERSIDMMKSWRARPVNERIWQGDIGN